MIWAMIRNMTGERLSPSTNCWISSCPPKYEKTEEKVQDPTNSQQTMAAVRAVR